MIYSPWGRQSGAHFNPAVTLTFLRVGKVAPPDALGYATFQALGGIAGVSFMAALFPHWIRDPAVNYVATVPGAAGVPMAWLTEFLLSAMLMSVVLIASNTLRIAHWTGLFAGLLVAANISLVAPLSGMSMNQARTLASAVPARLWDSVWLYFTAPPLGMLVAAQGYLWWTGRRGIFGAKLHHRNGKRCIFCESATGRADPREARTDPSGATQLTPVQATRAEKQSRLRAETACGARLDPRPVLSARYCLSAAAP